MLRDDHPNAEWLASLYGTSADIANDDSLDDAERERRMVEHQATIMERVSPRLVVHTGGVKLAATGDAAFLQVYARRRAQLAGGPTTPVEIYQALADDDYGVIYMRMRTTRGERLWDHAGMGAWRFEDGLAAEHWEISDGPAWDAFYLSADPSLRDGDAHEYWSRGQ